MDHSPCPLSSSLLCSGDDASGLFALLLAAVALLILWRQQLRQARHTARLTIIRQAAALLGDESDRPA